MYINVHASTSLHQHECINMLMHTKYTQTTVNTSKFYSIQHSCQPSIQGLLKKKTNPQLRGYLGYTPTVTEATKWCSWPICMIAEQQKPSAPREFLGNHTTNTDHWWLHKTAQVREDWGPTTLPCPAPPCPPLGACVYSRLSPLGTGASVLPGWDCQPSTSLPSASMLTPTVLFIAAMLLIATPLATQRKTLLRECDSLWLIFAAAAVSTCQS